MNGPPRKFRGAFLLALGVGGVALAVGAVALVRAGSASGTPFPPHETDRDAGTPAPERVFITGSLVNLREAASPSAKVLTQLPIGRECTVEEKGPSGWWRIRDGSVTGWAAAELLSPEKPTVEPLLALAEDSKRPLKERFDAALRAVTLEPEHAGARERIWNLFVEQELVQVEDLLAQGNSPRAQLRASVSCEEEGTSAESCLEAALVTDSLGSVNGGWRRFETQHRERGGRHMFVNVGLEPVVYSHTQKPPPQLSVRVGTYEGDAKQLDVQVFTASRYVPSDTLKAALAPPPGRNPTSMPDVKLEGRLSEEELGLLSPLSGDWSQLTRSGQQLVIQLPCSAVLPQIHLRLDEAPGHAHVVLEHGNDGDQKFEVMGVQRAKDGSVSLRRWNGHRLTYSPARDDEHLGNWKYEPGIDGMTGLFVREEASKQFHIVHPHCWDDDPPEWVE